MKKKFRVKENSVIAFLAKKVLRTKNAAIVIQSTIYLHGVSKNIFLTDQRWLNHERCHIRQYKQYGFFRFLFLYIIETMKHGYHNNRFEEEARKAEKNIE